MRVCGPSRLDTAEGRSYVAAVPTASHSDKRDYYEVLGVERDAAGDAIKRAYRKLAFKYHPDRAGDDPEAEERFKEAAEAYEVLTDAQRRATYDRFGHDGLNQSGFSGFGGVDDILEHFSDFFGEAFGFGFGGSGRRRGRRPDGPSRGADLQYQLELELAEAVKGCERELELVHPVSCTICGGSGAQPGSKSSQCETCGGAGRVRHSQGFLVVATTCPTCQGEGVRIDDPCNECDGTGQVQSERTVPVAIPPGVHSGVRLRIGGEGQAGPRGGPPGDLYVLIDVMRHETFERDGLDLHSEVRVPFFLAALGGEIEVETLDGPTTAKVPPGAQPDSTLKLRGAGVPHLQGSRTGDLICHLRVEIPKRLKRRQRELLEEFAQESGWDPGEARKPGFFERLLGDD